MAESQRTGRPSAKGKGSDKEDDPFTLPMLSPHTASMLFAPTGRKRDDVSHQKDAKKTKQSQIPPTMIPEQYHIREENPAPPFDPAVAAASSYDEKTKVWRTTVFPSPMPSSRQEVLLLEQWLDRMLLESQAQQLGPIEAVKRAQQLYAAAFHEILRQVYVTCAERGQLLDKIWTRYLSLFDHVLKIRDKERVQYNQKLQQQKLMYQQLYKDKDEAFNQVYLQLAAEKERIQMSRDKLERAVLLMQDDIRKRVRKETRLKRVVHHLRMRAKEMNVEEEPEPEANYDSDDSLLPPDLSADSFGESNTVIVAKLRYIEEKLQAVRKAVPNGTQDANFGSMLELDSLLHSLSDTISRLTSSDDTPALRMLAEQQQRATASGVVRIDDIAGGPGNDSAHQGGAVNAAIARHSMGVQSKFHIDKAVQYSDADMLSSIPRPLNALFSKGLHVLTPRKQERSLALAVITALYTQKIVADEECDAKEVPRQVFSEFVYDFFVSLYGVRTLAEQAMADVFATCAAFAPESLRIRTFIKFVSGELTRDDLNFFLYTLAQFYEKRDGDISFSESGDGTQWLTIDTARVAIDVILRDQDADAREAVLADCERAAGGTGRLELDVFLAAMTTRAHEIGRAPEEQLTGLYNAAIATDAIGSPTGAIIFDDLCALMRGFDSSLSDAQLQRIFRDVIDELSGDPPAPQPSGAQGSPPSSVLSALTRVCRAHGLFQWKVFPPTSADRRRCGEAVMTAIAISWAAASVDAARDVSDLQSLGAADGARAALLVQERTEELQRQVEARDNTKAAVSAFRSLNEQLWFARRRERKLVQAAAGGTQPATAQRSRT